MCNCSIISLILSLLTRLICWNILLFLSAQMWYTAAANWNLMISHIDCLLFLLWASHTTLLWTSHTTSSSHWCNYLLMFIHFNSLPQMSLEYEHSKNKWLCVSVVPVEHKTHACGTWIFQLNNLSVVASHFWTAIRNIKKCLGISPLLITKDLHNTFWYCGTLAVCDFLIINLS